MANLQNIFDKKIILDRKAAERLANAQSVACTFKGDKEPVIRDTEEMQKWLSSLTKEKT